MPFEQYKDQIKLTVDSGSVAFELLDEELFYTIGYKVLQNFPGGGLVRAMSSSINGNRRLVYDVSEYVPLSMMITKMEPEGFRNFALGLIVLIDEIRSNGFIHGENVCLDLKLVFINPVTYQVGLIYLPLKENLSWTIQLDSMDKNTIQLIRSLLLKYPNVQGESTKELHDYIQQENVSTERIREIILGSKQANIPNVQVQNPVMQEVKKQEPAGIPGSLILERVGGTQGLTLRIPAPASVIGRDPALAQVLIPDPSVSKKHCLICKESTGWKIEDLQSSNKTWLGGGSIPLDPYKQYEIKPGDEVKIARFIFRVKAGIGE